VDINPDYIVTGTGYSVNIESSSCDCSLWKLVIRHDKDLVQVVMTNLSHEEACRFQEAIRFAFEAGVAAVFDWIILQQKNVFCESSGKPVEP
jgi:hypothetical protein